MGIDLKETVSQAEFGALVGISQPAVSGLVLKKVLTPDADAATWLLEYCGHLREVAAGRAAAGAVDLATERALLAREQRERIAMQNAVTRKELAPVFLIEEVLAKAGAKAGKILDTIPGLIRRRVPSIPADALAAVQSAVAEARNIAAGVTLASLEDGEEEAPQGGADVRPPAMENEKASHEIADICTPAVEPKPKARKPSHTDGIGEVAISGNSPSVFEEDDSISTDYGLPGSTIHRIMDEGY